MTLKEIERQEQELREQFDCPRFGYPDFVESLDEVPADLREVYTPRDDGGFEVRASLAPKWRKWREADQARAKELEARDLQIKELEAKRDKQREALRVALGERVIIEAARIAGVTNPTFLRAIAAVLLEELNFKLEQN
jgi:hypothetical protein